MRNDGEDLDKASLLPSLAAVWFSSARSTEAMMRGTANESAVFAAVSRKPFVKVMFECGMLAMKSTEWMACSPDGVGLIDPRAAGFDESS